MVHFFRAGPDLVRWDLTEPERGGICRLTVHHTGETIIEYFRTAAIALLVRARGFTADRTFVDFAS